MSSSNFIRHNSDPLVVPLLDSFLQSNNSNNQISFMTRNEGIASLVEDSITLMAMILVLIPVFVVYFKRHCYLLPNFLIRACVLICCGCCCGRGARSKLNDLIHSWNNDEKTKNRVFFFILLHTVIAFLLFRIPAEGSTIAQHYFDLQQDYASFSVVLHIRRLFDYISIFWFTFNFSFIIPIWLKVCMVWVNRKKHRKIIGITMTVLLVVGNICLFCGLAPVTSLSIAALANPTIASDLEKLRKTFTTAIAIPLVGISTAIVFFLSIGTVVIIVYMLRQKAKLVPDNSEQYQLQKQTMVKLTIGVVILAAGVLIEVLGVGLYGLDVATYIFYPFAKAIPYCSFTICVALIFWPFHLPFLNNPIQFVMHEIKFQQKQEPRRGTTVALNQSEENNRKQQEEPSSGISNLDPIELSDVNHPSSPHLDIEPGEDSSLVVQQTPPTFSNISGGGGAMQEMVPMHHTSLSIVTNDDSTQSSATPIV